MTHLRVYEPAVMFFGLANSLATFQTMMNNILQDLIDTGDVAAFINGMLVEIENEKKYDKVVEEILRKMEANDLYLKPEKYI